MIKFSLVVDKMTPELKKIVNDIDNLAQETHKVWVENTPVKTGNARRKTVVQGNEIKTNYNYAVPLDQGRSKQAPRGMNKPTYEWFQRRVKKLLGA